MSERITMSDHRVALSYRYSTGNDEEREAVLYEALDDLADLMQRLDRVDTQAAAALCRYSIRAGVRTTFGPHGGKTMTTIEQLEVRVAALEAALNERDDLTERALMELDSERETTEILRGRMTREERRAQGGGREALA